MSGGCPGRGPPPKNLNKAQKTSSWHIYLINFPGHTSLAYIDKNKQSYHGRTAINLYQQATKEIAIQIPKQ